MDSPSSVSRPSPAIQDLVLIVDDDEAILDFLSEIVERIGCHVLQASTLAQARQMALQHENLSVVLCDQRLPDGFGLDFLRELKASTPNVVRILVTGFVEMQVALAAINQGEIFRFVTKPCPREDLEMAVRQALERYRLVRENQRLQAALVMGNEQLQQANVSLQKALANSLKLCLDVLDRFDHILASHSSRVARWAVALGNAFSMPPEKLEVLEIAAQLHDLGLISVSRGMHKHQQLGWDELPAVQQTALHDHPRQGAELTRFLPQKEVSEIILAHHEWHNGQGYPSGLAAENIPFLAAIIAIPDAYDEAPMNRQEAAKFVQDHLGVRFHPEVGKAFFQLLSEQPGFARNEREVTLQELEPGMKVMCNVFSASGILLIPSGQVLTPKLIQYIRQHNHAEPLAQRIFIES